MSIAMFLAQFWGWFMLITAIVFLASGRSFLDKLLKMHENKGFVFLSGAILLSLGLMTVVPHNVWVADWRIIITIAGWAALLKGATRVGFQGVTLKLATAIFKDRIGLFRITMVIVGFLGAYLIYMS